MKIVEGNLSSSSFSHSHSHSFGCGFRISDFGFGYGFCDWQNYYNIIMMTMISRWKNFCSKLIKYSKRKVTQRIIVNWSPFIIRGPEVCRQPDELGGDERHKTPRRSELVANGSGRTGG